MALFCRVTRGRNERRRGGSRRRKEAPTNVADTKYDAASAAPTSAEKKMAFRPSEAAFCARILRLSLSLSVRFES